MERKIKDLKDVFKNTEGYSEETPIYEFENNYYGDSDKDLMIGVTTLYPGDVNGEYYMTKGHTHVNPTAEMYYGLSGKATILLQDFNGKIQEKELCENGLVYCPPGVAHRAINKGDESAMFLCVCRADARGHNYSIDFKKRYFKD